MKPKHQGGATKKSTPTATPKNAPPPVLELPTVATLAALAASMATPAEEPESTASRAMKLWKACQQELEEELQIAGVRRKRQPLTQQEDDFLIACEISRSIFDKYKTTDNSVPLDLFLKAFKLKNLSKKWSDFWEQEVKQSIAAQKNSVFAYVRDLRWPSGPEEDIPLHCILSLRNEFTKFINHDRKELNITKGSKGARARIIRPITRKVLAGDQLTHEEQDIIHGLTPEEINAEVTKNKMDRRQEMKWKAAIHDSNTPPKGRPRVIKKRAIENS